MKNTLNEYDKKRDFDITSEPEGKQAQAGEQLRFVVQHHMARAEHYDFRLEWEGVMLSWAVPKGPSYNTRDRRLAVRVEDHPLDYRHFEGTIPKGQYGGGTVMVWDEGFWEPLTPVEESLQKGEFKLRLDGKRLKGAWVLIRLKKKAEKDKENWLLIKEKDEHTKPDDGISEFDTSVKTGRTMGEIEKNIDIKSKNNPFRKVEAQLAQLVDTMPEGNDWLYEVKYDGYRILAFIEDNHARLLTRNGNDYADRFTNLREALIEFAKGRSMVLDGEAVVLDKAGKSDFQSMQNYLKGKTNKELTYIVFDLLALDGEDLRNDPLLQRKERLKDLMAQAPKELHYSEHTRGDENLLNAACQADLEGIVGKKADSLYAGKRDGSWVKIKCDKRQEFVIGGFTLTEKRTSGVSALLLGVYQKDTLVYAGRAGTGISEDDMKMLLLKFKPLKSKKSYFENPPKERSNEKITWLKPQAVAEIKFAEWTNDNLLRQASFKGLRIDKEARDVVRESGNEPEEAAASSESERAAQGQMTDKSSPSKTSSSKTFPSKTSSSKTTASVIEGITITHPDKIVYKSPALTKLEVAQYYQQVADVMLPYIENRVLSVLRCPRGIEGSCFFLKHPTGKSKHFKTILVDEKSGDSEDYFYVDSKAGIIHEAQMGTLEFHPWGSRVEHLEQPDVMVFDLDPDTGMAMEGVRQGVRDIKEILDELSLTAFLKTSGGKGYHVVVPIKPGVQWEVFHDFAKNVAEVMAQRWPERYTANIRKENRKGKIFVDWIRNGRGATSVAPYSIRARAGAKVSMPIAWDELDEIVPDDIDMNEAVGRLAKDDPWDGFFKTRQTIE